MRGRTSVLLAAGAFVVLAVAVGGLFGNRNIDAALPAPPSTYLAAPTGASGLAEALQRMGVKVERWRRSVRLLPPPDSAGVGTLFAVLGPSTPLSRGEVKVLLDQVRTGMPLLLAGVTTGSLSTCWGWQSTFRGIDSIPVHAPGVALSPQAPAVRWVLAPAEAEERSESFEEKAAGVRSLPCREPVLRVDTLLLTAGNRPVLVRVTPKFGAAVLILSDPVLLGNRSLREHDLGPDLLRLIAASGRGVQFDEFHHGYDTGGGLLGAVIEWSGRSPWGWVAWQLAAVGVIALLVAMRRTGPIRTVVVRKRRSPLEHVRALATALRAARGHDVAVGLLVHGLRRRLSRDGRVPRGEGAEWLEQLKDRVRTPRARAAVVRLGTLTRPGRSADDVLAAANAVEVVWQELRP